MNEDTVEKKKIELSTTQIAGSALAAMSGAFFASWAGTAGTLVGAAVGSVIATVGAATYTYSLRRTSAAVRRTAAQVRATALVGSPARSTMVGPFPEADLDEAAAASLLSEPVVPPRRWNLPWARLALVSVGIMLVALAGLTAVEAVTGKPVSAYTGGGDSHGTTLGHAVGADSSSPTTKKKSTDTTTKDHQGTPPSPTPSPSPSTPAPTPSTTPTPTPAPTPSTGSTPTPSSPVTPTPSP